MRAYLVICVASLAATSACVPGEGSCGTAAECPVGPHGAPLCEGGRCAVACEAGFASCDNSLANGCEVEVASNPRHCGRCGHDCLGGACEAGRCRPVQVASGFVSVGQIAAYGPERAIYWHDRGEPAKPTGRLLRKRLPDGMVETLVDGLSYPFGVDVDAGGVYWTDGFEASAAGSVGMLAPGSAMPRVLAANRYVPVGIKVHGAHVYWAEYGPSLVMRVAKAGGAPEVLAQPAMPMTDGLVGIAVSDRYVFASNKWLGQIVRVSLTGGDGKILYTTPRLRQVAVDGAAVWWTEDDGAVMRGDESGAAAQTVVSNLAGAYGIALNGDSVYFADPTSAGAIYRAPKTGGAKEVLASTQALPFGLAVDDSAVYWTNRGDNTVWLLAK